MAIYDLAPPPDTSREKLEADAWALIETERDRRAFGGIQVGDYWFHSDTKTRTQLAILDAKATRAGWPVGTVVHAAWKTMSKVKVPMTVSLLRQILDAGIGKEGQIYDVAENHRLAMRASDNPATYDYLSGWPEIYEVTT